MSESIGTKDFEAAIEKISSGDAKLAAEGVAIVVEIEQESIKFYSDQAENAKGSEIESFFSFLANQERAHLKAVGELKHALEGQGKWVEPLLPELKKPGIFSKKDWDKEQGMEGVTAILFALGKEKQAQAFYEKIAAGVEGEGVKRFFTALAGFEKLHVELLGQYVDDSFYSDELIMG